MFYSKITPDEITAFAIGVYGSTLITFFLNMRAYNYSSEKNLRVNAVPKKQIKVSQTFFGMIKWEANDGTTRSNYRTSMRTQLMFEIGAIQKYDELRRRTTREWRLLYLRRFLVILLSIAVLGSGVVLVGYVTLYSTTVIKDV